MTMDVTLCTILVLVTCVGGVVSASVIVDPSLEDRITQLEKMMADLSEESKQTRNLLTKLVLSLSGNSKEADNIEEHDIVRRQAVRGAPKHEIVGRHAAPGAPEHDIVRRQAVPGAPDRDLEDVLDEISVNGIVTLLRGRDGNPGVPGPAGVPGIAGPRGERGETANCSETCQGPAPHNKYWSQENIENFLRVTDMPALSEFTACFYYEPNHVGEVQIPRGQYILSVASRSKDNEFLFGFANTPSRGLQNLGGHTITEGLEAFTEAHRHCFVWKDGHFLKWFYDLYTPGVLELSAQVGDSGGSNIPAGSIMTILNEQDTFGGGFDRNQMIPGNIADFQMWDRAFSNNEVRALRCGEVGNVVTFSDIDTVGTASYREGSNFRCSNRN